MSITSSLAYVLLLLPEPPFSSAKFDCDTDSLPVYLLLLLLLKKGRGSELGKLLNQLRLLWREVLSENVLLIMFPCREEDGETFDKSRLPRRMRAGIAGKFAHMMTVMSSIMAQ